MKHIIICIVVSAYFFAGCNSNTPKDIDHEHQQNEVDTDHEHEDEIIFTEEKAQAAGTVISEIQPKTFRNVIKTSGQVLAAQGDDMTIAATSSGIVSFGKASLTEGSAVNKGTILLSISAQNKQDANPAEKA